MTAQAAWAQCACERRLEVLRRARHDLAQRAGELASAISPQLSRTHADTMVAEILPLLEAVRFLEREAPRVLQPQRLGRRGLPFWLAGIDTETQRVPFGRVLIIGPSNYPLFLPGVQTFQALAAGNAVKWKPGTGGRPVAHLVAESLFRSGLPRELLEVTDATIEAGQDAVTDGADKVFFTGSERTGRQLLRRLAETATPSVVELSGSDAVVVLPSADLRRVTAALAFGMRLNGSATCMAPRRVLLVDASADRRTQLIGSLQHAFAQVDGVSLPAPVRHDLTNLLIAAEREGALLVGDPEAELLKPILILNGTPEMRIARSDIFAPVLTLIEVQGTDGVLTAQSRCPLALTASIFGSEREAQSLAARIATGVVSINDLIVPTADPRIPFGGRRHSGFGVTRGREGLLEMTAVRVVATRRNQSTRHYDSTGKPHAKLFAGVIEVAHSRNLHRRWIGLKNAFAAITELKKK